MERLKVLFVTNWYPTAEEPAKAVWVRELAKAARIHDDVVVLHCVGPTPGLSQRQRLDWVTDERVTEGVPTYRLAFSASRIPASAFLRYVTSVARAMRELGEHGFRPQILHAHIYDSGAAAVLIGARRRLPVVVSEHFSSFPRRLLGRLDVLKAKLAFRWADVVLPVSRSLQAAIEAYGMRARFQVLPNVADTALFHPSARPHEFGDSKRLLFVGQLVPVKGLAELLEALARLDATRSDWHLDVIGGGVARKAFEQRAVELNLTDRVSFHGLQPKSVVAEFMRRADLFVLPSLFETFSAPAAEALASGTPVLSTRCGGPEEFIVDEVGALVPGGDVEALRAGLEAMLGNLHRYSRERIAAYARERFSPEVVGSQLHDIYRAVLERRASRRA